MIFQLKPGERYCVDALMVESHGIMLSSGRKYAKVVKEDDIVIRGTLEYLEIRVPDILFPVNKVGEFWLNTETHRNQPANVWYMVYKAWMSDEQYQDLLHAEIEKVTEHHIKAYETLLSNAKIIHDRVKAKQWDPSSNGLSQSIIIKP